MKKGDGLSLVVDTLEKIEHLCNTISSEDAIREHQDFSGGTNFKTANNFFWR
uniref:Uncharacterized protein n=1 Tax=uncultured bacterium contig00144 TaxID=1181585 RepID=A0A806KGD6_9BACT|nr:hypothetical protein [uncultured bacterium contig00144]